MSEKRIVTLPFFPGFYNSLLSSAMDQYEEQEAEYRAEQEASEEYYPDTYHPEHLRISKDEYASIYFGCCDYQRVYLKVAQFWVKAFDWWCEKNLKTPEKSFTWESMVSPREYNFVTDRVFAYVPEEVIEELFARSAKEEHKTLAQVIKDNFTSYDGFMSYYSNELEVWLEKPLKEWDYNELGTLVSANIIACEEFENRAEFSLALYCQTFSGNGEENEALDAGMDLPKFEEKVKELRSRKAEEHESAKEASL
jgi:hypothetical protein